MYWSIWKAGLLSMLSRKRHLHDEEAHLYAVEIMLGVQFLHRHGIVQT
jgi:hypothetical protein